MRRAAALTAELAAQSQKKTAVLCDQPPGLDELAGHIEAPNMGAGGSHPQAAMMPDPWATYKCPSAEEGQTTTSAPPEIASCASADKSTFALTRKFHGARPRSAARDVEVNTVVGEAPAGKDRTQKRPELVNTRPGVLRRCREPWQSNAEELQRFQGKREQAWEFFQRQARLRPNAREEFERKFEHKVMNGLYSTSKVDEKSLDECTEELRTKAQATDRRREAREAKQMELEDSSS